MRSPTTNITIKCFLMGVLVLVCVFISGCDSTQRVTNGGVGYFPLDEGRKWSYRVITSLTGSAPVVSTLNIKNIGRKTSQDKQYWVRRTSHGTDYYFQENETGIYRVAKRTIVETKPRLDKISRMVMPLPTPKKVGKSWSVLSQSYTLHRVSPNYEPPFENVARFHMTYTVVGLDEEVTVPAGTFKNCLLIEGQAQIDQHAGANTDEGDGEIEITTREWYAPNVGMVKMERNEPLDGSVFKGGSVVMELR
jgi:hypothetical protein